MRKQWPRHIVVGMTTLPRNVCAPACIKFCERTFSQSGQVQEIVSLTMRDTIDRYEIEIEGLFCRPEQLSFGRTARKNDGLVAAYAHKFRVQDFTTFSISIRTSGFL